MKDIISGRHQQSVFEALASVNRAAGSGGGSGLIAASSPGYAAAGNQGGFTTANSSTWADITNSTFTILISRTTWFEYRLVVTGHITGGAGTAYVRGNIVGFDVTASPWYNSATFQNGFMWYFPFTKGPIPPGQYTVKLQVATDAGTTLNVDQLFHQIFLGAQ